MIEFLEVFDEKNRPTGVIQEKSIIHSKGYWHRAAPVFVFNPQGEMLIQKRSNKLKHYPGFWDVCFGGHVTPGKSYKATAASEIHVELGIIIYESELFSLGSASVNMDLMNGRLIREREHQEIFCVCLDRRYQNLSRMLTKLTI